MVVSASGDARARFRKRRFALSETGPRHESQLNADGTSMRSKAEIIGKVGTGNFRSGFSGLRGKEEFEALTPKTAVHNFFRRGGAA